MSKKKQEKEEKKLQFFDLLHLRNQFSYNFLSFFFRSNACIFFIIELTDFGASSVSGDQLKFNFHFSRQIDGQVFVKI